jgi:hypothetical protein
MNIIAFAGRKQSGKTTCAMAVASDFELRDMTMTKTAMIYNFADPLKQLCIDIFGIEYRQCYGCDEDKNELVDCYWGDKQLTAREVLQIVGTDMFRTMQHHVWSSATIRKIEKEMPDLAIIADCRFPNEVDAIKNVGGIVIKLTRNPHHSDHASEIALDPDQYDQFNFDLIIENHDIGITEQNKIIFDFLQFKGILPL